MSDWRERVAMTGDYGALLVSRRHDGRLEVVAPVPKVIGITDELVRAWESGDLAPGAWFSSTGHFGIQTCNGMFEYELIGLDRFRLTWIAVRIRPSDDE